MKSGDAKYREVFKELKGEILSGKYDTCRRFPSQTALIRRFGISKLTVVKTLDRLKEAGLIRSHQGRGTFLTGEATSRQVGLIVPGLAYSEFFHPIVVELSRLCQEKGHGLLLGGGFSSDGKVRERQAIELAEDFVKRRVCGVIMQPTEMSKTASAVNRRILQVLDDAMIPVVLLDSDIVLYPERSRYDVVGIDNADAGRRTVRHFVAQGARRITFASWPYSCTSIVDRQAGARAEAHEHRGVSFAELLLDPSDGATLRRHVRRFRPDAIVCGYDTFAAYLKMQLEKMGRRVPDDILLAGFDDLQDARITTPPLTTSHQPCADLAHAAFSTLMKRIANRTLPPQEIVLHAPLVVRASTTSIKSFKRKGRPK